MLTIELPISKSIANRLLILQAMHGDPLLEVSAATAPDDVLLLASLLSRCDILSSKGGRKYNAYMLNVQNCGTAMRFLTAYYACREGVHVVLDGCERMHHRPIGQLVDALRGVGADIRYLGEEGYPPLEIHGKALDRSQKIYLHKPVSTQFVSTLMLCGFQVETNIISPYIELTRKMVAEYPKTSSPEGRSGEVERDWSAAAFWLERYTLGLCEEPVFPGLRDDSMQGDRVARDIFQMIRTRTLHALDCSAIPDLVPAIAVTCHELGQKVQLTGTESLRIKESDRLDALEQNFRLIDAAKGLPYEPVLHSYGDHRIAMAFLAAGYKVDDIRCINKSYPMFYEQLCSTSR